MSSGERYPEAEAAVEAAVLACTTTVRTFGEAIVNRAADSRSTKQTNSSSGAIRAIASTISRAKRPYPRSFDQHVPSTPISNRCFHCTDRFSSGPARGDDEYQRERDKVSRSISGLAHRAAPRTNGEKEWNGDGSNDDLQAAFSFIRDTRSTEEATVRKTMAAYRRKTE
jgi:hypothetical protein